MKGLIYFLFIIQISANLLLYSKEYKLFELAIEKEYLAESDDLLDKYTPKEGLGDDPQKAIEEWLQYRKGRKEHSSPFKGQQGEKKQTVSIDLSEVIAKTLQNQWNIKIGRKEVQKQEGVYQSAKGPFNPVIGTSFRNNILYDTQQLGYNTHKGGKGQSAELFLEKMTRLGTKYTLKGTLERLFDPSLYYGNLFTKTNQYDLSFTIDQPLLRGLKYSSDTVNEKVSEIKVKAIENDFIQIIANEILDVVNQYWELVSAKKILEIDEASYKILHGLARASERLVQGEKLAQSELNEQFAELSRASADIVSSEQRIYEAYNNLLLQMGLERETFPRNTPLLQLDDFPQPVTEKSQWDVNLLLQTAKKNRGDLIAAQLRIKEAAWLLKSAKNAVLPSLDLIVGIDVSNNRVANELALPFFSSVKSGPPEKDVTVMLNFSIPLFNDTAKGEKKQREAELSQAILEESKFDEKIRTSVASALRNQLDLIDEMYFVDKAVQWYETTLRDELARLKEGYSSLFIVIDYEKRLRNTFIEKVLVQKEYAQNLTQLLYETGTLVKYDKRTNRVSIDILDYNHLLRELEQNSQ